MCRKTAHARNSISRLVAFIGLDGKSAVLVVSINLTIAHDTCKGASLFLAETQTRFECLHNFCLCCMHRFGAWLCVLCFPHFVVGSEKGLYLICIDSNRVYPWIIRLLAGDGSPKHLKSHRYMRCCSPPFHSSRFHCASVEGRRYRGFNLVLTDS